MSHVGIGWKAASDDQGTYVSCSVFLFFFFFYLSIEDY